MIDAWLMAMLCVLFYAVMCWIGWYGAIIGITRLASRHSDRLLLYLTPPACLLLLAFGLADWDLVNLQDGGGPLWLCFAFGALWLALANFALTWLGLSARDDVAERRNRFAGWAISGAQVGLTLAFAAATAGTDPADEMGTAVFLGVLSTMALFGLWGILEWWAGLSEAITVQRDGGAACRLAAFLVALGPLLGQAVAGLPTALESQKPLLPLVVPLALLLAALLLESWCQRTADPQGGRPKPRDVIVALTYLAAAGLFLFVTR